MKKPRICGRCEREFYTPEDVEPKLKVPKRPPTGTTYVTHEPESSGAGELFPRRPVRPAPEDIGPPAPGEGEPEDGYPNPEVGMTC